MAKAKADATAKIGSIRQISGGVTAAVGFIAGGTKAGIKQSGNSDLGIIYSEAPCSAAGAFTTNAVRAACVNWNESILPSTHIHAILVNSGNANACTGKRGEKDAEKSASLVASEVATKKDSVLVASTGIIGHFLPLDKIEAAVPGLVAELASDTGAAFAEAIMTTDTVRKEYAISAVLSGGTITIGGCCKGAGMIHPKMATMLCFITSDAAIGKAKLNKIVKRVVDRTFNNLTVDGDTSTNDMVLVLSNGLSAVAVKEDDDIAIFEEALYDVCNNLCARIAADGEGATKRIEIHVSGGKTYKDCQLAAKAVANSNLTKCAIFGNDPNWGRISCAVGYSGASIDKEGIKIQLCGTQVFKAMQPAKFSAEKLSNTLKSSKVVLIDIDLGFDSKHKAVAHTCDLTYDYIKINADYHT